MLYQQVGFEDGLKLDTGPTGDDSEFVVPNRSSANFAVSRDDLHFIWLLTCIAFQCVR